MTEGKQTNKSAAETPALGMKLSDIYYVLFRRKWLIASFLGAGLLAALAIYFTNKPAYVSEAKLLVRYVIESKSVVPGMGGQVKSTDNGGETIINSELEILTSLDLCEEVASLVGPEKILGGKATSNSVNAAAFAISKSLTVENPRRSNIIKVRFIHSDPAVCQAVLRQLITSYYERHQKVHGAAPAFDDVLSRQASDLYVRVQENEEALRKIKSAAGVTSSIEDTKISLGSQADRLQQEIFTAEAQLAEHQALVKVFQTVKTNGPATDPKQKEEVQDVPLDPEKVSEYKMICGRLDSLRSKEFQLRSDYTEANPQVKRVRDQIADTEKRKKALEAEHPKLAGTYVSPSPVAGTGITDFRPDPAQIPALEARIKVLTNQLAKVRFEFSKLDELESRTKDLDRKLKRDEKNYNYVSAGLAETRIDELLGAGKMSNIQTIQSPSVPSLSISKHLKFAAGALLGAMIAGLALAFLIEIFVDHTVRRAGEFETKLHIPLFLSIPKIGLNGHAKMLPFPMEKAAATAKEGEPDAALHNTWAADHPLRPYVDGLRDRTLIHFDGDPHKPKLIGITSCSKGVGATSIAAGLAGALSETGDGNVLLLNLNFEDQAVHPFYRGELACGLSDALELDKRHHGMVMQNLYVASAGDPTDPEYKNLPKQLARVVPKLRVADYDYIVFDLPPTTPTTMTARLAGMMDLVILVVESEKDTQDSVKQAGKLLSRSKAHVSAVLNKVQNPVPLWLHKGV